MNREDFPMLLQDIIYFDNGATTFKPQCVIDSMNDYYTNYTANAHRGDYDISQKVDSLYEDTRSVVKDFINASKSNEIIFTKGTTESINMIVFGFMKYYLHEKDEVLITKTEHASNVLPWFELERELGIRVNYIPLDKDNNVTLENIKKVINNHTKVISIAHITNTIGDMRPVEEITKLAHQNNILMVVDGAQSVPHIKTDVIFSDVDFLSFSSHKMMGPTGVGVLYGKEKYLKLMKPLNYGGGMNNYFESDKNLEYRSLPLYLEAGTQNISGVIGFREAIKYINKIGLDKIHEYELELRKYLINKLLMIDNITIYNEHSESGIVLFNIKDIFAEDTSHYLNHYKICVRAGNHCAKMVKDMIDVKNTCRISLYIYNNKEEVDRLIDILNKSKNIFEVIL